MRSQKARRPPTRRQRHYRRRPGVIKDPITRAMKRVTLERRRRDEERFERAAGEAVVL